MGERSKEIQLDATSHPLFESGNDDVEDDASICKRRMIEAYFEEKRLEHMLADYDAIDDRDLRQ